MATLVTFHAHPDDEAISTGGTMAKAASAGHRVVLVVATRGELGDMPEDVTTRDSLAERRVAETMDSARVLGVQRVEFLCYRDSGMLGTPENEEPDCFWRADLEEAAGRVASVLVEEEADVLVVYDENGHYGHPDHIQVHRVGVRAAELAGTPRVYQSAIDRDRFLELAERTKEHGLPPSDIAPDLERFAVPGEQITTRIDVTPFLDQKRAAMAAHSSQIAETSLFLDMTPELFAEVWGEECYIRRGADAGAVEHDLFDDAR